MKWVCPVLLAGVALVSHGCKPQTDEIVAPVIHFGQDTCAKCSMIISDDRFAGAIGVRQNGRINYLLFDDVGEMLEFIPPDHEEMRRFVTDATTTEWLIAEEAFYLHSDELMTPMGTGVGAYATKELALTAQERFGGNVLVFRDDELQPE